MLFSLQQSPQRPSTDHESSNWSWYNILHRTGRHSGVYSRWQRGTVFQREWHQRKRLLRLSQRGDTQHNGNGERRKRGGHHHRESSLSLSVGIACDGYTEQLRLLQPLHMHG